jgi:predicted transport protein
MIFQINNNNKVKQVSEKDFNLEKEIQNLVENNMAELLNLEFITSEFTINNFRIDTLGFDKESNSFMIVEFKRGRNESLIDQGYTYLNILFDRKADFVLKYNEVKNKTLKISDIDWEQSRVIFISPKFTDYQIKANDFRNNPIELIQIKRYENDTIEIDKIKKNSNIKLETNLGENSDSVLSNVDRQIKVYTEENHLVDITDNVKELYFKVKDKILELDNIDLNPKKFYISFQGKTNIVDVILRSKDIQIIINLKNGELDDPKHLAKDVSSLGHWGNGDYRINMANEDDIEYIMSLVKQSWKKNKK